MRLLILMPFFWLLGSAVPVQAQSGPAGSSPLLEEVHGHLMAGPTMWPFSSVPPVGAAVGLGGTAHQRGRVAFDTGIWYLTGVRDSRGSFNGLLVSVGIGYSVVQTASFRLFPLLSTGYGAVGVTELDRFSGTLVQGGLGLELSLHPKSEQTRWTTLGLRAYYQYLVSDYSGGGVFVSLLVGQGYAGDVGTGCNCSGM